MSSSGDIACDPAAFWHDAREVSQPLDRGQKTWFPYELHSRILDAARSLADPIGAYRDLLQTERDPLWREVLLFLAATSDDPRADDLLLDALDDPQLRPRALYLLGTAGTKGWPRRSRDETVILRAIRPFVDDPGTYTDIVHDVPLAVADLAAAAYARVAGPDRVSAIALMPAAQARWIGLALPAFPPQVAAALTRQIREDDCGC